MPSETPKKQRRKLSTRPPPLYRSRAKHNSSSRNGMATHPRAASAAQWRRIREEQLAMPFLQTVEVRYVEARPFLKWAGGKASLLGQFDQLFPETIDRYFEPVLGGGAVFFHLKHRFPAMRVSARQQQGINQLLSHCSRSTD